jgi:histidinol-phosphate aminotransferase
LNLLGMAQLTEGLRVLGLDFIPSFGNFVSFHVDSAARIYRRLLELGVIVRPVGNYSMPDYLRVSIGLESQNQKFLSALKQILGETA